VSFALRPERAICNVPHALEIRDGGTAELLNDQSQGPRRLPLDARRVNFALKARPDMLGFRPEYASYSGDRSDRS
jgi:hypothetical protein